MAGLPLIIDTDGGVDDAAALWWALTCDALDVVAITTVWGNVDVEVATDNVCRVLDAVGRTDIPVAPGEAGPVGPAPALRRADFIHGRDGLGDTGRPAPVTRPGSASAVEVLTHVVADAPGEVAVLTLGPLSNLGQVLASDPAWASSVRDLVVMGGVVELPGNALPAGEANVADDPVAAARVVHAPWASPPLLVGLDVTHRATLGPVELELLAARRNEAAGFLADPLAFYRVHGAAFVPAGECPCHDLVAAMALVHPEWFEAPVLPLSVQDGPGPAWGATVADRRVPFFAAAGEAAVQEAHDDFSPWHVGLGADVEAVRSEVRRLLGG